MRILIIIISLFCVAMVHSCDSQKNTQASNEEVVNEVADTSIVIIGEEPIVEVESEFFMTYERTYCFGMCPVFKSSISNDGSVSYEGINFVDNMGKNVATLNETQLQALKDEISNINYFELDSAYDNAMISDLPSIKTSVLLDGKTHAILDRWKSPDELKELYKVLDGFYDNLDWKPLTEND